MSNKNIYEIGLLINPDLSQQGAEESVKKIKKILTDYSASVISEGEVVDIDLAYQIITKIASKNERFNQAFFSWVKFEVEPSAQDLIKKEVDKIKKEVFRYLIVKSVKDDEATDKYQKIENLEKSNNEEFEDGEIKEKEEEVLESDILDTTTEDDLTKIEGIGPVISETLVLAGVKTFSDLAQKTTEEISEIIAGVSGSHNSETWPKQAEMAAAGNWDELEKWQEELNGGKE